LVFNYLGQGAYLLAHLRGQTFDTDSLKVLSSSMPDWFRLIGTVIVTTAALVASQALISG